MKTFSMTILCALATVCTAVAAPLNPADLPQQAKWVIHLDHDAFSNTNLAQQLRNDNSDMVKDFRQWMQEEFGVNPQEELHGVTLFSDSYKPHSGAAILHAHYDRQKVESSIKSKQGLKTSQWQNHTLYTWEMRKMKKHSSEQRSEQHSERAEYSDNGQQAKKTVSAMMLDRNTILAACSEDEVKTVARLLEGEEPSLKGVDSMLVEKAPKDAIIYGSAIDLNEISEHEGVFPILQQHKRILWAFGETDNDLFEKVNLVADNDQVASKMKTVLEGFVALVQVWAGDAHKLARLYEKNVEIDQDGNTVHVDWHGETQEVIAGLHELKQRMQAWREARRNAQRK